jgi:hypothetical protein
MENLDLDINNYSINEVERFFKLKKKEYTVKEIELREIQIREQLLSSGHVNKRFKRDLIAFLDNAKKMLIDLKVEKRNTAPTSIPDNYKLDNINNPVYKVPNKREENLIERPQTQYIYTQPGEFLPGKLNQLNTRVISKCLNIDTRFRTNFHNTNSSDITIQLPTRFNKVVSMELTAIELPVSFYGISENYGNNYMHITLKYTQPSISEHIKECFRTIVIPDGNYTETDLIDTINFMLSKPCDPIVRDTDFFMDEKGNVYDSNTGKILDTHGNIIDASGNIIEPFYSELDFYKDSSNNIVDTHTKNILDPSGNVLDTSGNTLFSFCKYNTLFDKDLYGNIIDNNTGNLLNIDGDIVDPSGQLLYCLHNYDIGESGKDFQIDSNGNIIDNQTKNKMNSNKNIFDTSGKLLFNYNEYTKSGYSVDNSGNIIDNRSGNILNTDGNIIDANNEVLFYFNKQKDPRLKVDGSGNIVDNVTGFKLDTKGNIVDKNDNIIDPYHKYFDDDDNMLDCSGNIIKDIHTNPLHDFTTDEIIDVFSFVHFILDINENGSGSRRVSFAPKLNPFIDIKEITIDFSKNIRGEPDNTSLYTKLGWNLGFTKAIYRGDNFYNAETIIEPATKYLYLAVDDFNNNSNSNFISVFNQSIMNTDILARISIKGARCNLLSDTDFELVSEPRLYFGPVDIQRLRVRLLDEHGRVLQMNNSNYSFCLKLKMMYDL